MKMKFFLIGALVLSQMFCAEIEAESLTVVDRLVVQHTRQEPADEIMRGVGNPFESNEDALLGHRDISVLQYCTPIHSLKFSGACFEPLYLRPYFTFLVNFFTLK